MKVFLILVIIAFTTTMRSQTAPVVKERPSEKVTVGENGLPSSETVLPVTEPDQHISLANDNTVYNTAGIQVKPEYPGGIVNFHKHLAKHFRLPAGKEVRGSMWVTFIVEKDGKLTDIKIIRDIGHGSGSAMVQALKRSPKWLPGEHNGFKIRTQNSMRINIPFGL